jgi:hypothetical protein
LFRPRPGGPRDRFIAEINPTPTLYNVQNVSSIRWTKGIDQTFLKTGFSITSLLRTIRLSVLCNSHSDYRTVSPAYYNDDIILKLEKLSK